MVDSWLNEWDRLKDPNFGDGFTLPLNTPIGCCATTPNRLELAAVGKDTAVYGTFFDNNAWHGHWYRIADTKNFRDGFTLPLNTPITAISRKPGHLDLFAVGKDTAVYWTFCDNGNWSGQWNRIEDPNFGDKFTLPLSTPITAVSRFPSHIDILAVGKNGVIYTTYYDDNGGWSGHWSPVGAPNLAFPLNTPIAAVSRFASHIDILAVHGDTTVCTTYYDDNGYWQHGWARVGDTRFGDGFTLPLSTPITAVSRFTSHIDVVAVGKDTAVYATYYDDNGQWQHGWNRLADANFGDKFTLPVNTPIAAVSRVPSHLDLFAVGKDTAVYSTYWDDNGGWLQHWFRLGDPRFGDDFTLPLNTPIAAASRDSERIDLVAVGKDTAVYSEYWGQFPDRPVMAGNTATFNPGYLTSSLALGGTINVVFNENGDFTVTGHAHDSGGDPIDYVLSAVIMTQDGTAFTFQHSGTVHGLDPGSRDDPWNPPTANNASITKEWAAIPNATIVASLRGKDELVAGLEGELQSLIKQVLVEVAEDAVEALIILLAA
jgi:hypothetical protein